MTLLISCWNIKRELAHGDPCVLWDTCLCSGLEHPIQWCLMDEGSQPMGDRHDLSLAWDV